MLKLLSLFSGIGAFEESMNNLGINYELVNYCEFKPRIAKAYSLIHNVGIEKNLGDISKVDETQLEDFDFMTYGFPCQDISALGDQKGFIDENGNLTRSGLFFEAMRIAKYKKPKYMIAENVRALTSKPMAENFKNMLLMLEQLGYNTYYQVLNTKDHNLPQSRNRVFLVSIRKDIDTKNFVFPDKQELKISAKSLYQSGDIPEEFYVGEMQHKYFNEFRLKKKYSSVNADVLICMTTKQGQKSNPQNFIKDDKGYRILTDSELFAFQGFKREYGELLRRNGFKTSEIGYMCGNSISVPVIQDIIRNLLSKYITLENNEVV